MPTETFVEELRRSGYLHRPLPMHEETTREARLRRRTVLDAKTGYTVSDLAKIWNMGSAMPSAAKRIRLWKEIIR